MSQPAQSELAVETQKSSQAAANPSARKSLDSSLVRSVAWNAASDWGTQIFTWLAFLEVMRLLTPTDFGIAALALIMMPFLGNRAFEHFEINFQ